MATIEVDPTSAIGEGTAEGASSLRFNLEGLALGEGLASLVAEAEASPAIGEGVASATTSFIYSWRQHASMPEPRQAGATVVIDDFLYYIGGMNPSEDVGTRSWFKYDHVLDVWTQGLMTTETYLPSKTGATSAHARRYEALVVEIDGIIYSLGGYDRLRYDPQNNVVFSWNPKTNMIQRFNDAPGNLIRPPGGLYDGKVWYFQGYVGETQYYIQMKYWDPATDTHVEMASDSVPVSGGGGAWGPDNKFHAFSGSTLGATDGSGTIVGTGVRNHRIYDPVTDTWSAGPPLPTPENNYSYYPSVVTHGDEIYIINAIHPSQYVAYEPIFLKYDPFLETYSKVPVFSTENQTRMSVASYAGAVWALGGASETMGDTVHSLRSLEKDLGVSHAIGEGFASDFAEGWSVEPALGVGIVEGEAEVVPASVWLSIHGGPVPLTGEGLLEHYRRIRSEI